MTQEIVLPRCFANFVFAFFGDLGKCLLLYNYALSVKTFVPKISARSAN